MGTKNIGIIIVLILLIGVGGWFLLGGKKGIKEKGPVQKGVSIEEKISEIPLPEYPNMAKTTDQREEETGSFLTVYRIEEGSPERAWEINDFYKASLPSKGWELEEEKTRAPGLRLIFLKEGDRLRVNTTFVEDEGWIRLTLGGGKWAE